MIEIESLSRIWKNFSLNELSLKVESGEYFVILGPTGAGKTLLLELIAGFHVPDSGRVLVDGKDVTHLPPEKHNLAFVYQNYSLFPHMSVKKNIEFGMRMKRIKDPKRVLETARDLKITHLLDRNPLTLSGGEQQRVALARALVTDPKILLLDEPLSALDPRTQENAREMLSVLHKKNKLTVLHITHDQTEARIMADRIAVVMDGKLIQVGTPKDIFENPVDSQVASFVGFENVLKGMVISADRGLLRIETGGAVIDASGDMEAGDQVYAFLRPENIALSKTSTQSSIRNSLQGRVTEVWILGALVRVKVDCGVPLNALITRQSAEEMDLSPGVPVYAQFKASSVHVLR
ncbi:sulfate ABC transporter ATP-binding protein [Methanosarcina sp. 2.H.T.1A.6]|uniref:ATP-binding cassette domain-containing protein n=1 Tax=unclassified Methanosarcina TaxID=2644672 RepID=UPI00062156B5|nr:MULTISPECIES: ATP-binding cassette domain-containing protein [unclassified Methanosarcina]KKG16235.1 sulfate ABC transporter ATP-binding protein [Methanosarcina sp. 2.H.T.1A.3]KKG23045.1 sulfate ABC transporter ATP-binding protein [Methanosarcina sp. 2.H.T.1A.6]KKG24006.1 sulfate ABC transporter ATP-binding protein [Methanosarcina sp. 2.H.T.1A.15]KKG26268.1 sulfate ABC transporter ATP-binding protein [Methanosarcina sp. 2.H.T.1A.8]